MIEIPGFTVTEADPTTAAVLLLLMGKELGYVRPSDEWVDGTGEPLPDDMQDAAHRLFEAGLLHEFEEAVRG